VAPNPEAPLGGAATEDKRDETATDPTEPTETGTQKDVIPDGGYGWVIVGAILASNAVTWGEWGGLLVVLLSTSPCRALNHFAMVTGPRLVPADRLFLFLLYFSCLCIHLSAESVPLRLNPAHTLRHQHNLRRLLSLLPRLQLLPSHHARLRVGRRPLRGMLPPLRAPRELPHQAVSFSPPNVHG
jgi:hypothetical protein